VPLDEPPCAPVLLLLYEPGLAGLSPKAPLPPLVVERDVDSSEWCIDSQPLGAAAPQTIADSATKDINAFMGTP
jgi:hypothetical protein